MTEPAGAPGRPDPAPRAEVEEQQPCPDAAATVFGDRLPLALRYADLLCGPGVVRGLVGPREPARIWSRHLLNSAALAPFIPPYAQVIDLGSGAGLPGVPLVIARPDLTMTLLEPQLRRTRFLSEVRDQLGLTFTIERARAEGATSRADVVVARAVAPLARLIELALPLLRPGGALLAQKGAQADVEVAAASSVLLRWPHVQVSVHPLSPGDSESTLVRVALSAEALPLNEGTTASQRPGRGTR